MKFGCLSEMAFGIRMKGLLCYVKGHRQMGLSSKMMMLLSFVFENAIVKISSVGGL
jgi:hypothetical protein